MTEQTKRANLKLWQEKLVYAMEKKAEALVNMEELEHIYWTAQEELAIENLIEASKKLQK